jgi:hypothetical protein
MAEPQKDDLKQKDCSIERVFLANDLLPNAAEAFAERIASIEDAVKTADIVLDTNVLLLPYGAGASSLKHIISIFKNLKKEERLYLPAQVAREFVKNRPNKLSELQHGLPAKISKYIEIDKLSYPILEDVAEYQQLNAVLENITKLKAEVSQKNSALLKKIRSWEWNDPVNTAYREVFSTDRIIEPAFNREDTLNELVKRQNLLIPPGYKDAAKEDLGIGDFLIWKTILEIGAKNKKHVIFVSGDEKADWQHRSGGSGFLPRYELVDEFRRASGGKSFFILPLSKLLELLKVETASIEEIKKEEGRVKDANTVSVECPNCDIKLQWHLADHVGASAAPYCPDCGVTFHIHRTREGVTIHRAYERTNREPDMGRTVLERVACPNCKSDVEGALGTYPNATMWCRCGKCEHHFPIHRKSDGSVMISSPRRSDLG